MPADWQLPPGVTRALWDYLHDPETAQRYDERLADTPLLALDQAFVLEHCQPPGRLLDMGCGTGRLSLTLAQRGYRPIAVDLSPEMLKVLGSRARAQGVEVPRLCANLVDLSALADASFDHAACLFSTLGMIAGAEARRRVLAHAFRLLRPGGKLVVHAHNRWFNVGTRHGRRLLWHDVMQSWLGRRPPGDYDMPPHEGLGAITMHLFTRREITSMLRAAGFRVSLVQALDIAGSLRHPWWLSWLRSYGYLVLATKQS